MVGKILDIVPHGWDGSVQGQSQSFIVLHTVESKNNS